VFVSAENCRLCELLLQLHKLLLLLLLLRLLLLLLLLLMLHQHVCPQVCVFLLSLRAGSAGLTLTSATRVFLLEPAMDPSIEQQAVARVHRIGQEKEVVITRLLMADTVEEEVGSTSCFGGAAGGEGRMRETGWVAARLSYVMQQG
jgi:hypothetical protein